MLKNSLFLIFCPTDSLDSENRPVLEGRSIIYKLEKEAYSECFYNDCRFNSKKLMNIQSLQSFHKNKNIIRNIIRNFGQVVNTDLEENNPNRLFALSYTLFKSVNYFYIMKIISNNGEIEEGYSHISRFSNGLVNILLEIYSLKGNVHSFEENNALNLYQFADREGFLIGNKEVCAAPKNLIIQYLELINESLNYEDGEKDLKKNIYYDIYKFSSLIYCMELITLIYETVRCYFFEVNINTNYKGSPKFSITHCLLAQKISRTKSPFNHDLFKRLMVLNWANDYQKKKIEKLLSMANKIIDSNELNTIEIKKFKLYFEELINEYKLIFEEIFNFDDSLTAPLEVFFGKWP